MLKPRQHDEELARRRVESSPLQFFSINRFNGNHPTAMNSVPRPDNFVTAVKNSGDKTHVVGGSDE